MSKTTFLKALSCILCIVLIAAMALVTSSCSDKAHLNTDETESNENASVGFTFIVKDADGNETVFDMQSSKPYLLDALLDEGLVEGKKQSAGFYVKQVNGIVADYDIDQTYWALYIDGEYATKGADSTPIEEGKTYMFAVEKG